MNCNATDISSIFEILIDMANEYSLFTIEILYSIAASNEFELSLMMLTSDDFKHFKEIIQILSDQKCNSYHLKQLEAKYTLLE